jgi:hypothetical protein
MKKWVMIGFTLLIGVISISTASASTIPVNVSPGLTLEFRGQSVSANNLIASLGFNPNDDLALGLGYSSPSNDYIFSVRYLFVENIAVAASYANSDPTAYNIDLRLKYDFDESLALVGLVGYNGTTYFNVTGQTEYWFSEQFAGNIGFSYNQSTTSLILGAEFLIDRIDMGLDCRIPADNSGQSIVVLFVAYKFN